MDMVDGMMDGWKQSNQPSIMPTQYCMYMYVCVCMYVCMYVRTYVRMYVCM